MTWPAEAGARVDLSFATAKGECDDNQLPIPGKTTLSTDRQHTHLRGGRQLLCPGTGPGALPGLSHRHTGTPARLPAPGRLHLAERPPRWSPICRCRAVLRSDRRPATQLAQLRAVPEATAATDRVHRAGDGSRDDGLEVRERPPGYRFHSLSRRMGPCVLARINPNPEPEPRRSGGRCCLTVASPCAWRDDWPCSARTARCSRSGRSPTVATFASRLEYAWACSARRGCGRC